MAEFVDMEAAHSGDETSEGGDDDGGSSMRDFIDDGPLDDDEAQFPRMMEDSQSQSAHGAGPSRAHGEPSGPSSSHSFPVRAASPGAIPDGLGAEFRRRLGDSNDRVNFLFELPGKSDNEIVALLDMVSTHVVECSYTDLLADLFGLAVRGPGDIEASLLTNSWTRLVTAVPIDLHGSVIDCNTSAMTRLHGLLGQVEERMLVNYRDTLNTAISRVFSIREVLCTLLESRMDARQMASIPNSVIRLTSGNLDVNDFQRLLILITNLWKLEGMTHND
eukprot:jgi/Mesvir1/3990/Mv05826-RA.1